MGIRQSKHHEWISDDICQLVENKRATRLAKDFKDYKELNRRYKKSARLDKQRWNKKEIGTWRIVLVTRVHTGCLCSLQTATFHLPSHIEPSS